MYLPCNIGDTLKLKNYMFFIWNSHLTSHSVVLFVNSGHPRREGLGHRHLEPPRGCGPEKAGWALRDGIGRLEESGQRARKGMAGTTDTRGGAVP